jgi:hypothetical protein
MEDEVPEEKNPSVDIIVHIFVLTQLISFNYNHGGGKRELHACSFELRHAFHRFTARRNWPNAQSGEEASSRSTA